MKVIRNLALLTLVCALAAAPAAALDYTYTGHDTNVHTENVFVNVNDYLPWRSGGSARAMGMAGAYTAIGDDLAAIEYNPAGLANVKHLQVSMLGVMSRNTELGATSDFEKKQKWETDPSFAAAAFKLWRITAGVAMRRPHFDNVYQSFGAIQNNVRAPDGYVMQYDRFSDRIDVNNLKTYTVSAALDMGHLAVGANFNAIDGTVFRYVRGRVSSREGTGFNSQFNSEDRADFSGYTGDLGALAKFGFLKLGFSAKNMLGNVKVTQDYLWRDDFAVGAGNFWVYDPGATEKTYNRFAPTYTGGVGLDFGKLLLLDVVYEWVNIKDREAALVRAGVETRIIPFLPIRAGFQSDVKNSTNFNNKEATSVFLGTGLKIWVVSVDGSLTLAQLRYGREGKNVTGAVSAGIGF